MICILKGMNILMNRDDRVQDLAIRDKPILLIRNELRENLQNFRGQNFREDFIDGIAKTYGAKIL